MICQNQGGVLIDIPFFCVDYANDYCEISKIIHICDGAFQKPICNRIEYQQILDKIFHRAIFLYAYASDIQGYCALYANDMVSRTAYITLIGVQVKFQNHHVGTKLMNTALGIARKYGMLYCELEVDKNNHRAIEFYKIHGFFLIREGDVSLWMRKEL